MTSRNTPRVTSRDGCASASVVTLCVFFVTVALVTSRPQDKVDDEELEERWLEDYSFYDVDYPGDQPQADGTGIITDELCPPVPKSLPPGSCDMYECGSDRQCVDRLLKCCYNGCVYTCLPDIKPPPYFDWIKEPRRRLPFGSSWLVPGPDLPSEVDLCSTTPAEDDSDPLICPHGFECSVHDIGQPDKGIPNTGHCARVITPGPSTHGYATTDPDTKGTRSDDVTEDHASLHACHIGENLVLLSGHEVELKGRTCVCDNKVLRCEQE